LKKKHTMKEQLFNWIAKIIETCTHDFHFEGVDNLINLFYEREQDENLKTELQLLRNSKWNEIHFILE